MVCYGKVRRGFEYPILKFAVITESDIFGRSRRKRSVTAPMRVKNTELYRFVGWGLCSA
ncbi:MAG: hypothetical protein ACLRI8_09170 [Agathobacter rectalis]